MRFNTELKPFNPMRNNHQNIRYPSMFPYLNHYLCRPKNSLINYLGFVPHKLMFYGN